MKALKNLTAVLLLTAALPMAVNAGTVQVTFTDAEHYTDAKSGWSTGKKARQETLNRLQKYMELMGERYLAPNQTLKIEVLDVDLAGRIEWWHSPNQQETRILRDITSPSMKMKYSLEQDGKLITSGEELVADRNYLMGISNAAGSNDTLRYEKIMLNEWFRKRFASGS